MGQAESSESEYSAQGYTVNPVTGVWDPYTWNPPLCEEAHHEPWCRGSNAHWPGTVSHTITVGWSPYTHGPPLHERAHREPLCRGSNANWPDTVSHTIAEGWSPNTHGPTPYESAHREVGYTGSINECLDSVKRSVVIKGGHGHIPRVPESLRRIESNKKYFDPVVVSLGPYHYNKQPHFHKMQRYKLASVNRFFGSSNLNDAYNALKTDIMETEDWYEAGEIMDNGEKFACVMFVDTCFVLDCIYDFLGKIKADEPNPRLTDYLMVLVLRDMMLLENQLPLALLKQFMTYKNDEGKKPQDVIDEFIEKLVDETQKGTQEGQNRDADEDLAMASEVMLGNAEEDQDTLPRAEPIPLTGLPSPFAPVAALLPPSDRELPDIRDDGEPKHLLDCLRKKILGTEKNKSDKDEQRRKSKKKFNNFRSSVTELKEKGIRFQASRTRQPESVDFKNGWFRKELRLPRMVIDDTTKYKFLNMMAYEFGSLGHKTYEITSYVSFMNSLIDTKEDVQELRSKKIIINYLGSDEEVAQLFNTLTTDTTFNPYAYDEVRKFLEKTCKNWWWVNIVKLRHTRFDTPWKTFGFVVAVFLIFLTAVQAYFTVFIRRKQ